MALQEDYEWAIGLNRLTLEFVGLWPKANRITKRKSMDYLRVYLGFTLMMCFLVIPEWWSLVRVRHDFMLVIDNLQLNLAVTSAVLKFSLFYWGKEGISEAMDEVEKDWMKRKTANEKDTMLKQAKQTRKLTMSVYILVVAVLSTLCVPSCFGLTMRHVTNFTDPGKRPLLVQSYFFYDITKTWNFLITQALQVVSFLYLGIFYTGIDCFFVHLVLHVCAQLENLAMHLTSLADAKDVRSALSFCVKEHVRLIRFVQIIDNAVNTTLLVHLLIFTALTCSQGLLFIKVFNDGADMSVLRFMWLVCAILAVLVHVFVYCLVGEVLLMRCEEMYEAAYNNDWYTLQPHDAKMLLLILIRARPPLYITAGKMFPMILGTFCSVIKTSVSYISVLLAFF